MITKQTAYDIAVAYDQIERGEKLLDDVRKQIAAERERGGECMRDVFGRRVGGLELGVPSGENGRRLYNVPWELAQPVIRAHIAALKSQLEALNVQARLEAEESRSLQRATPLPPPPEEEG